MGRGFGGANLRRQARAMGDFAPSGGMLENTSRARCSSESAWLHLLEAMASSASWTSGRAAIWAAPLHTSLPDSEELYRAPSAPIRSARAGLIPQRAKEAGVRAHSMVAS